MNRGAFFPNFFIVGAAKAGTTSLARYLSQHPEIHVPAFKEPNYFLADFGLKDAAAYEALFRNGKGARFRGDASTTYLYDPGTPERILEAVPDAKIIVILRSPPDMAYSFWRYMRATADEEMSFEQAISPEERRRRHTAAFRDGVATWWPNYLYVERACYAEQVARYLAAFGRDRVCVSIFERFVREPAAVCRDIFRFLGAHPAFTPDCSAVMNESGDARFEWIRRLRNRRYPLLRALVPARARAALRGFTKTINLSRSRPQGLPPEVRRALEPCFEADVARLRQLLGDDIPEWAPAAPRSAVSGGGA